VPAAEDGTARAPTHEHVVTLLAVENETNRLEIRRRVRDGERVVAPEDELWRTHEVGCGADCDRVVEHGIEVEPPELLERRTRKLVAQVVVGAPAGLQTPGEIRNRAASVRYHDAQTSETLQHAREHEPRERDRRLERKSNSYRECVPVPVELYSADL
jgi:hypothetical protein